MRTKIDPLFHLLPKEQIDPVFGQEECGIDKEFMGFTDIYKNLSEIIPKHFTIVDLGCAYNPQCFYFKNHKKYVAVDSSSVTKFKSDNCEIYCMTIGKYIQEHLKDLDLDETFAICSFVNPQHGSDSSKLTRDNFKNVFTYYPHDSRDRSLRLRRPPSA